MPTGFGCIFLIKKDILRSLKQDDDDDLTMIKITISHAYLFLKAFSDNQISFYDKNKDLLSIESLILLYHEIICHGYYVVY